MASVMKFFADYLVIFIIGSIILLFALLGYFIENGFKGKKILKSVVEKPSVEIDEVEQLKSNIAESANQSLNQIVQNNSEVLDLDDLGNSNKTLNESIVMNNNANNVMNNNANNVINNNGTVSNVVNDSSSVLNTNEALNNNNNNNNITFGQPVEVVNPTSDSFEIK